MMVKPTQSNGRIWRGWTYAHSGQGLLIEESAQVEYLAAKEGDD